MTRFDTTLTEDGVRRTVDTSMIGEHVAHLEKIDDTTSWGPGHADWVCERCGFRAGSSTELRDRSCDAR